MKSKKILLLFLFIIFGFTFSSIQNTKPSPHANDASKAKISLESQVIRVVDGDTIVVSLNQKPETIRLLGINTPETVAPNKPVACYGREASEYMKELLTDKVVKLEPDASQDNRDKYDRLLRYVFLDDLLVNEELVRGGYAREYTYKIPYKYQKEFRAEQKIAKGNLVGLWGVCD